jgi:hypothetical protein
MKSNPFVKAIKSALSGATKTEKPTSARKLLNEAIAGKIQSASLGELVELGVMLNSLAKAEAKERALSNESIFKSGQVVKQGKMTWLDADKKPHERQIFQVKFADGKIEDWQIKPNPNRYARCNSFVEYLSKLGVKATKVWQ